MDAVGFLDDAPPEAQGVGFVEDEVESAANGALFALEDQPSGLGGGGDLGGGGVAAAPFWAEIGDFVFDEGAH